jgi:ribosomal protein L16 Arg81 hydroxylase
MSHQFFPGYIKDLSLLPSWEEIIFDLDKNIQEGSFVKVFNNGGFATHNGHLIPSVAAIQNELHKKFKPEMPHCDSHIYISLLSNSGNSGSHKDTMDIFFILSSGIMDYNVEGVRYSMVPGDMLYFAKGAEHEPILKSPRFGISIGFPE